MKKHSFLSVLIIMIAGMVLSCATGLKQVGRAPDAKIIIKNIDPAGSGRITIRVSRPGAEDAQYIYVSPGEIKYFSASSREQHAITARYGRNVEFYDTDTGDKMSRWADTSRYSLPVYFDPATVHTFTVCHNPDSYGSEQISYYGGRKMTKYDLTYSAYDVLIEEAFDTSVAQGSLRDTAIQSAFATISGILPDGAKIAVVNVSSDDSAESEYIIEELSVLFVNSLKYTVVDRRTLDLIREEHNFQTSGEVDDASVVSIGHFLGADIVLTGSISGEGAMRRLRFRALDVKTAQVLAMSSERL